MNISVHREFNLIDLLNDKSGRQNTSALVVIESNNKCTVRISNECGSGSFAFNF